MNLVWWKLVDIFEIINPIYMLTFCLFVPFYFYFFLWFTAHFLVWLFVIFICWFWINIFIFWFILFVLKLIQFQFIIFFNRNALSFLTLHFILLLFLFFRMFLCLSLKEITKMFYWCKVIWIMTSKHWWLIFYSLTGWINNSIFYQALSIIRSFLS